MPLVFVSSAASIVPHPLGLYIAVMTSDMACASALPSPRLARAARIAPRRPRRKRKLCLLHVGARLMKWPCPARPARKYPPVRVFSMAKTKARGKSRCKRRRNAARTLQERCKNAAWRSREHTAGGARPTSCRAVEALAASDVRIATWRYVALSAALPRRGRIDRLLLPVRRIPGPPSLAQLHGSPLSGRLAATPLSMPPGRRTSAVLFARRWPRACAYVFCEAFFHLFLHSISVFLVGCRICPSLI